MFVMIDLGSVDVPRINQDLYENAVNAVIKKIKMRRAIFKELLADWDKKVKFELELIAEAAVSDFYLDYTPKRYVRQEDLYNAYKVIAKNGDWRIEMGSEFMQGEHDAPNDYIYNLSFVGGWHGGAQKGDLGKNLDPPMSIPHPTPSDSDNPDDWSPRWVSLMPFPLWGSIADRMGKPYPAERIKKESAEYIEKAEDMFCEEFLEIIMPYYEDASNAINALYNSIL